MLLGRSVAFRRPPMSNQKYILTAFLSAAVFAGFSVRGLAVPLLARLEVADPLVVGFAPASSMLGVGVGAVVFAVLTRHKGANTFTDETVGELRRVTWPDREETIRSTSIVVGATLFLAGVLSTYDFVWAKITNAFLFNAG
jgi:preprotein translocase SecE subunit